MRIGILKFCVAVFSIVAGAVMTISAASAGDAIGWMEIKPVDRQIGIAARAYALEPARIEFELQIERIGRSGKTASKQHGKADIEPGKIAELSTSSVNIGTDDQLAVLLTISSGGRIISTSALHVGPH